MTNEKDKQIKKVSLKDLQDDVELISKKTRQNRFDKLEINEKTPKSNIDKKVSKSVLARKRIQETKDSKQNKEKHFDLNKIEKEHFDKYRFHYSFMFYRYLTVFVFSAFALSIYFFRDIVLNSSINQEFNDTPEAIKSFFIWFNSFLVEIMSDMFQTSIALLACIIFVYVIFSGNQNSNDLTIEKDGLKVKYDFDPHKNSRRVKVPFDEIKKIKYIRFGMFKSVELFDSRSKPLGKIYLSINHIDKLIPTLKLLISEDHVLIKGLSEILKKKV